MKKHRKFLIWASCFLVLALTSHAAFNERPRPELAAAIPVFLQEAPRPPSFESGSYEAVQELFNTRCISCHSCNNAPCQLKLTSFEGLQRGATKIEAIHPTRLRSIPPMRLGIDAHSTGEWRGKGFFPVADDKSNLIVPMINQGPPGRPRDTVADSHSCPASVKDVESLSTSHPEKLMPFGLPPLSKPERDVLGSVDIQRNAMSELAR